MMEQHDRKKSVFTNNRGVNDSRLSVTSLEVISRATTYPGYCSIKVRFFKQSSVVVYQNCALNNPQFSWTFLWTFLREQCQVGRKLTVEGHLFNKIDPLIKKT